MSTSKILFQGACYPVSETQFDLGPREPHRQAPMQAKQRPVKGASGGKCKARCHVVTSPLHKEHNAAAR